MAFSHQPKNYSLFSHPLHRYNLVSGFEVGDQFADIDHAHRLSPNEIGNLIGINGCAHDQVNVVRPTVCPISYGESSGSSMSFAG